MGGMEGSPAGDVPLLGSRGAASAGHTIESVFAGPGEQPRGSDLPMMGSAERHSGRGGSSEEQKAEDEQEEITEETIRGFLEEKVCCPFLAEPCPS